MARVLTTILACIYTLTATVFALDPIIVKEQEFLNSATNDRFVIVGIDYQQGGQGAIGPTNTADPLSNGTICLRDAALMQSLGVNTIRIYNLDPTLNHDDCASIFNDVGIYMLIDVNTPITNQYLDRYNPSSTYNIEYLQHIFTVVEAFKSYPNTLGFFSGNEIIYDLESAGVDPPYIRAVQRDLKNYIAAHADRVIPVGYSAADIRLPGHNVLLDSWTYLQCDNSGGSGNDTSRSDFFGLNSYSWCGSASNFQISGYAELVSFFSNTTIPVFFSEYGCNQPAPRVFDEVPTLYGPQMQGFSGGLVYEWTQEADMYGLINYYPNGSASLRQDYYTLAGQYAKLNVTYLESSNSTATSLKPPACNSNLIPDQSFNSDFNIPAAPDGADALISSGISNPPSGTIVSVTQTSVQVNVYATDGSIITPLAITIGAEANEPGSSAGGMVTAAASSTASAAHTSGSPSSSSAAPTSSKGAGNGGYKADMGVLGSGVAAAIFAVGAFAL